MKRFTELYERIDATTRTSEKVRAMVEYLRSAPPVDAAWTIFLLTGGKIVRAVSSTMLRELVAEVAALPPWLVAECHHAVGDLSETLALLTPEGAATTLSLHDFIQEHVVPLGAVDQREQRRRVRETWQAIDRRQRFLFHKMISTNFRVGMSRRLVIRAIAEFAGIDVAVVAHRLGGRWSPSEESFRYLVDPADRPAEPGRPYPFCLAHPLEGAAAPLEELAEWQVEWKWDGIRAQLLRRQGQCMLWSRGDELVTAAFPELVQVAADLPDGTVLDGEILAWEGDRPLPFARLQRRLNRKQVAPSFWPEVPVAYLVYDLLEADGRDVRETPQVTRRQMLEQLVPAGLGRGELRLSPILPAVDQADIERLLAEARERGVEGIMLKRGDAAYAAGRPRGTWWKLKVDPFCADMVMVAAQLGHGRRASLFTDYTFAVLEEEKLVTVTKAYSGLSDQEIREVDRWVRRNTVQRHGPVREVRPELVFELAFEGIAPSSRHCAGLALRFPRIARWRRDKRPEEADTLESLRALLDGVRRVGLRAER